MAEWKVGDVARPDQRPGFYSRFITEAVNAIRSGQSGVVACVSENHWGPLDEVKRYNGLGEFVSDFGDKGDAYKPAQFIFAGGAATLLMYRPTGAGLVKASRAFEANTLEFTAKHEGTRGNNLAVKVTFASSNPVVVELYDTSSGESVLLNSWETEDNYVDVVNRRIPQLVDEINNDPTNIYIDASTDTVRTNTSFTFSSSTDTSATTLSGGVNPTVDAASYEGARDAFSQEVFSTIYFNLDPATDSAIITSVRGFVNTWRDEGKKITWVTGSEIDETQANAETEAKALNHLGANYVHPGLKLIENNKVVVYAGYQVAAHVAGVIASAPLSDSLTYRRLNLVVSDVEKRYGDASIKSLIRSGVMPLVYDGRNYKIERGVTTLTQLESNQNNGFKKVKIVRILDSILNALNISLSDNVIGQTPNNKDGRSSVISTIRSFLSTQADADLIRDDYIVIIDPNNPPVEDRFFILIGLIPVDSIEYVYTTIEI